MKVRYEYAVAVTPNLDTLPKAQRALWPELAATPETFTLYGGTALALRLGHRTSVDFDFSSNASFDADDLERCVSYIRDAELSALMLCCGMALICRQCWRRERLFTGASSIR